MIIEGCWYSRWRERWEWLIKLFYLRRNLISLRAQNSDKTKLFKNHRKKIAFSALKGEKKFIYLWKFMKIIVRKLFVFSHHFSFLIVITQNMWSIGLHFLLEVVNLKSYCESERRWWLEVYVWQKFYWFWGR